jgi:hypothetical protein
MQHVCASSEVLEYTRDRSSTRVERDVSEHDKKYPTDQLGLTAMRIWSIS